MDGQLNKTMSNDPEVAKHVNNMYDMLRKNQMLEARLKEIVKLTDSEFEEVDTCSIKPEFLKGVIGTHHLSSHACFTVFDFVRIEDVRS